MECDLDAVAAVARIGAVDDARREPVSGSCAALALNAGWCTGLGQVPTAAPRAPAIDGLAAAAMGRMGGMNARVQHHMESRLPLATSRR
jgi:hypothetical protein